MNRYDKFKRDTAVLQLIKEHKGCENPISTRELVRKINDMGYELSYGNCAHVVQTLVFERNVPICSLPSNGYFWACSKKDIVAFADSMRQRVNTMLAHIEIIESFIIE